MGEETPERTKPKNSPAACNRLACSRNKLQPDFHHELAKGKKTDGWIGMANGKNSPKINKVFILVWIREWSKATVAGS